MRSLIRTAVLAVFLLSSAVVTGASLEQGLDAYAQGDYEKAWEICQPLADEGNVEAMFCVGQMYANGFGVMMDDANAMKWFGLAAGEGHPEAMYRLAVMHANGWGVPMNDAAAAGFYRLAAGFGYIPAQSAMGYCFKHGAGVEKDLEQAYMWFAVAAHNGDMSASAERDKVADRLTPEQLQSGKDRVKAYLASHEGQAEQRGGES
ncbi:MAG: tetratricopeptide repeat protein [Woeseiaceae bacterium]|nr:tetratricopeptide repeat protein [Woeseiaceae bacterium]